MGERKKRFKVKSDGLWLTSFADLSFLLMAFFALMLSFSSFDKQKFENVQNGMLAKSPKKIKSKIVVKKKTNNLENVSTTLLKEIKKQNLEATVKQEPDGLIVELNEKILFPSGSARLHAKHYPVTKKLLQVIASASTTKKYELILEGHTDDLPLGHRSLYRDNWALSSARAVTLLNELHRFGISESQLSIMAFAHTRPKVSYSKLKAKSLSKARAANRRVVIRIKEKKPA